MNATDAGDKINAKGADGDVDKLFLKALGIRWVFLDELSTTSPYLLGLLDAYMRRTCCRHQYARFVGEEDHLAASTWLSPETSGS